MKKQFLFGACLLLAMICLVPGNNNKLQACVKNVSGCSAIIRQPAKAVMTDAVEDADVSFDMFMNPLSPL